MGVIRVSRIDGRHTCPQSLPLRDGCHHLLRAAGHVHASLRTLRPGRGFSRKSVENARLDKFSPAEFACFRKDRTAKTLAQPQGTVLGGEGRGVGRICDNGAVRV